MSFHLTSIGYKETAPGIFDHPDGHPFYRVTLTESNPDLGMCLRAIAQAAYTRGSKQAEASVEPDLMHCNTCGFQIARNYPATKPIEGFPHKGPYKEPKPLADPTKPPTVGCMNDRRRMNLPTARICDLCGLGPCARDNISK